MHRLSRLGPSGSVLARGWPLLAATSSGGLLAAAYAPWSQPAAAWIALVPLLLLCFHSSPRQAARWGGIAGALFWLANLYWITHVTWPGWIALALYCSLYLAAFAAAVAWLTTPERALHPVHRLALLPAIALCWVGTEYARATWFTGFAWNPLGNSQYANLPLIQIAQLTGVYGISAVIVVVNVSIALSLHRLQQRQHRGWPGEWPVTMLLLLGVFAYGHRSLQATAPATQPLRSAVIQPDVPQNLKWTEAFVDDIYARLESLTTLAITAGPPDLVIWPETAVPDYLRESRRSYDLVRRLTRQGAPLLIGTMDVDWPEDGPAQFYNSAMLFDTEARLLTTYDKQHLVMFGEYVPLEDVLPFLTAMTPIEASFDAGEGNVVFTLPEPEVPFSVLICFEDTVARLARKAVHEGARLLINQTNDAWFEESSASWQHLTHSVLRAVENQVPVVRAANNGVSCGITRFGQVHSVLTDANGSTFVQGLKVVESAIAAEPLTPTFYTRHGDLLGVAGLGFYAVIGALVWREARRRRSALYSTESGR